MEYHYPKIELSEWERLWLQPLFETQPSQNNETNWPQKRLIISSILKSCHSKSIPLGERLLAYVIHLMKSEPKEHIKKNELFEVSQTAESLLLAAEAIKMASELEVGIGWGWDESSDRTIATNGASFFKHFVPRQFLDNWMTHSNPQVRLATLSLIVDSKKTSELLVESDFEALKTLLEFNIVCQYPAFRQQFLSYFKKVVSLTNENILCLFYSREFRLTN